MKLVSWNVNGIRACMQKGFREYLLNENPDVMSIQEAKYQYGQEDLNILGYKSYNSYAFKKGYSGVSTLTRTEPLSIRYGLGIAKHDTEGRLLTLEFESFFLVNCYTPNSKRELERLPYRCEWEEVLYDYLIQLREVKPVVLCGDLNVAHNNIDVYSPVNCSGQAGYTIDESVRLQRLIGDGFIDSFRFINGQVPGAYTYWSYMYNARANNRGWRLDYFLVSEELKDKIVDAKIRRGVYGSDHCPITLELNV